MLTDELLAEIENGCGETLRQAARRFPSSRRGRPVTLSCLLRWTLQGVRVPGGVVKLEAARCAGRWITTPGACRRFVAAQTPDKCHSPPTIQTAAQQQRIRRRSAARAEAERQQLERELEGE